MTLGRIERLDGRLGSPRKRSWSALLPMGTRGGKFLLLLAVVSNSGMSFGWSGELDEKPGIPIGGIILRLGMGPEEAKSLLSAQFSVRESAPGTFSIWEQSADNGEEEVGSFGARDGKIVDITVRVGKFDGANLSGFVEAMLSVYSRWAEDRRRRSPQVDPSEAAVSLQLWLGATDEIEGPEGPYTLRVAAFRSANRALTLVEKTGRAGVSYKLKESLRALPSDRPPGQE